VGYSGPLRQAGPTPVIIIVNTATALPGLHPIQAYGATTSNGLTFFSTPVPYNPPVNNLQPIQPVQPSQGVPLLTTRGS